MNHLNITSKENYQIIQLDRGTSNAINYGMITELKEAIANAESSSEVAGVILTGKEKFFSAGLDVIELAQLNEQQVADFWKHFHSLIMDLTKFSKPLISAITGHSPAGGCVFAICSDYRVMAEGNYRIGLNEIPVGIALPPAIFELYAFWIGHRYAYQNLMEGKLLLPAEALAQGLLDEVVSENEVLEKAEAKLKVYLSLGHETWQKSKRNLRCNLITRMDGDFDTDFKYTLEQWWSEDTQMRLKHIVASLTSKK